MGADLDMHAAESVLAPPGWTRAGVRTCCRSRPTAPSSGCRTAHGSVSVIDTTTGRVLHTRGGGADGLSLFPQPGEHSIGHNGVYR